MVRTPRAFSQQITARPTGPQPSTIATSRRETEDLLTACSATAIGSVSTATSGDSPLGTTNDIDCSTSTCSAYPPGASGESPIGCASCAAADQRERDDVRALAELAARAAAPLAHLADELVAQHGGRRGPHELVVVELLHHLGEPVAVLAGVQVGAADAAAQHAEHQLALVRRRVRQLHHGQLGVGTRHRPHRTPLMLRVRDSPGDPLVVSHVPIMFEHPGALPPRPARRRLAGAALLGTGALTGAMTRGRRPRRDPPGSAPERGRRGRGRRRHRRSRRGSRGRPQGPVGARGRGPQAGRRPGAQPPPDEEEARRPGHRVRWRLHRPHPEPHRAAGPGARRADVPASTTPATASTCPRRSAGWSTPARSRRTRRSSRTPRCCSSRSTGTPPRSTSPHPGRTRGPRSGTR